MPFSTEHYENLLFVGRIRQGLENKTDAVRISAFVNWFWQTQLASHMAKEEAVLLPLLTQNKALKEQLLNEHAAIRFLVREIHHASSVEFLHKLVQVISNHIRFEEQVLFKYIEVSATAKELRELEIKLAHEQGQPAVWQDPFWAE